MCVREMMTWFLFNSVVQLLHFPSYQLKSHFHSLLFLCWHSWRHETSKEWRRKDSNGATHLHLLLGHVGSTLAFEAYSLSQAARVAKVHNGHRGVWAILHTEAVPWVTNDRAWVTLNAFRIVCTSFFSWSIRHLFDEHACPVRVLVLYHMVMQFPSE